MAELQEDCGSASGDGRASSHRLTQREAEALHLLRADASTGHIAATMRISLNTARRHIERLLTKLGVHSRVAAVAMIDGRGDS
jgi:DNA-binding CsgD family transcriptional regulator